MSQHKKRPVNGFIIVDKPIGMRSNQCLSHVKHLFRAQKAGHTGSLDMPASGLLPICLGQATKVSSYLLNADKTYQVTAKLGITTTTGDAAGEVTNTQAIPPFNTAMLQSILQQFIGDIEQIPPMYSALKHQGIRLYQLAYQGINVERKSRPITIHQINIKTLTEDSFTIEVHCSKGTYIRTLIEDIGNQLGCGAHTIMLRRIALGQFTDDDMITISQIDHASQQGEEALSQLLHPADRVLSHLAKITLDVSKLKSFCMGQAIQIIDYNYCYNEPMRIYDMTDKFVGLGMHLKCGYVAPKRLFCSPNHYY